LCTVSIISSPVMGIRIFRKLDDRGGVAAARPPDHFSRA
jgi:hypothetical protein